MNQPTQRKVTKQECERAAELLQGMVQRAKKAVEAESSTQIESGEGPPWPEKAGEASDREAMLKPLPQLTVALGRTCDGLEFTNDNVRHWRSVQSSSTRD